MTRDPDDDLHRTTLRVTGTDPKYAGYWFRRHRETERIDEPRLAAKLGTDLRGLALMALCLAPRHDQFSADVTGIAARAGVGTAALAQLFRQEMSIAAWQARTPTAAAPAGWLLAAHDDDQPPPIGSDEETVRE